MGERTPARSRSGFRRRRRLRRDRRGVVAVVGTLLALLVFFALFGIFLTQYVPLWMEENENQLSNQMQVSLSTLKSGIDDQYIFGDIPTYSVPFTVSSQSVPLLAQPTEATLSYLTGCPAGFSSTGVPKNITACDFERVVYTTAAGATGSQDHTYNQTMPTNYLEVALPNRYFTPVTYFFENDGLAGTQSQGREWMVVPPPLNVTRTTGNLSVQSSLLDLLGNESSFTGQGTKDLSSHLSSHANVSSVGRFLTAGGAARTFNVTEVYGVHALCAWYNFLYNETDRAFGSTTGWSLTWTGSGVTVSQGKTYPTLTYCELSVSESFDLTLTISNVNYATAFVAQSQLNFNAGGL